MRIAFYGDDFTGATDALLQYHRWGLHGRLFLATPSAEAIAACTDDVIGVAGVGRSLSVPEMSDEIGLFLRSLRNVPIVQYKICSTFDSSPEIGSIGHVIRLAKEAGFQGPFPVVPAQPHFGRYTLFADHYAKYDGAVYRLDRHPTMSNHPTTPMHESDLRVILASQGVDDVASFDILDLHAHDSRERLRGLIGQAPAAIVFDALEDEDLARIGDLIIEAWPQSCFAIGSGGVSYAIGARLGKEASSEPAMQPEERVFVVSGSMAPQTAQQISWATEHGWKELQIDARFIDLEPQAVAELAARALSNHQSSQRGVIVSSRTSDGSQGFVDPRRLGALLGAVVAHAFRSGVARAIICGGDTSSYAARALDAHSLSIAHSFPTIPAAVCRLHADDPAIDGKLIALKGGQIGGASFFEKVRTGVHAHGAA